jgi:hypothetical protein
MEFLVDFRATRGIDPRLEILNGRIRRSGRLARTGEASVP